MKINFEKLMGSNNKRLPDAIIIGVQKSGTSSLFSYLSNHPNISGSWKKEVHFFDNDDNYKKGFKWYKKQFPNVNSNSLLIEATPNYLYYEKVAMRLFETGKPFKFIVSIRDPVQRAFSAWNMYRQLCQDAKYVSHIKQRQSKEHRLYDIFVKNGFPTFDDYVKLELKWLEEDVDYQPAILKRGFYTDQLNKWFQLFDKENFLFLNIDDLKTDKISDTLSKLCLFLGVEYSSQYFPADILIKKRNSRAYTQTLQESIKEERLQFLTGLYKEKNKFLEEITAQDHAWLK